MDIPELGFLMVLALILFGPEELPTIARKLGGIIYDIKKASQEVQQEVRRSVVLHSDSVGYGAGPEHKPGEGSNPAHEAKPEIIDFTKEQDQEPIDLAKGQDSEIDTISSKQELP